MRQDGEIILKKYLPSVADLPKTCDQLSEMLDTIRDVFKGSIKDQFLKSRSHRDMNLFTKVRKCKKT